MFQLSLAELAYLIPAILIALSFHEYAHGRTAMALGDNTPVETGRNTLNPLKHIDPVGFVLLMVAGFGWAKPVLINPGNFKRPRRDELLVALAGPGANFMLVLVTLILMKVMILSTWVNPVMVALFNFLYYMLFINLSLMLFNLLPFPPLDGSRILMNLLPNISQEQRFHFFRYGSWFFLALILLQRFTGKDIIPIGRWVQGLARGLMSLFQIG